MAAPAAGRDLGSDVLAVQPDSQGLDSLWALAAIALTPLPVYVGELTRLGSPLSEPLLIASLGVGTLVGAGVAMAASLSVTRFTKPRVPGCSRADWPVRAGWTLWAALPGAILATWAGGAFASMVPGRNFLASTSPTAVWLAPAGFPASAAHLLPLAAERQLLWQSAIDAAAAAAATVLLLVPAVAFWRGRVAKTAGHGALSIALVTLVLLALGSGLVQTRLAPLAFNPIERLSAAVGGSWQPVLSAAVVGSTLCWLATACRSWPSGARREGPAVAVVWGVLGLVVLYHVARGWGWLPAPQATADAWARGALALAYVLAPLAAALAVRLWRVTWTGAGTRPRFTVTAVGWLAGVAASLPFLRGFGLLSSPFLHQWLPTIPAVSALEPLHPVPDWALDVGMGAAAVAQLAASGAMRPLIIPVRARDR